MTDPATYRYHPHILAALERHGIRPQPTTDPHFVYGLLKAIYTFRIREMKFRRREAERVMGPQPLERYRERLRKLQEEYPSLKIPAHHWVERGGGG